MDERKVWFTRWIKHKDLVKRAIKAIKETSGGMLVEEKTKTIKVFFPEALHEIRFETLSKDASYIIVLWNKKTILKEVISLWDILIHYQDLLLVFLNLQTEEEKWLLRPAVHHKIADPKSLEEGLYALSERIPFLDESVQE